MVQFVGESVAVGASRDTIPTAVLLTGVNMPDHNKVFAHLIAKLAAVTAHVAVLGPGLNIKSLIQQIVLELTDDDGDEKGGIKKADASLSALDAWYTDKYPLGAEVRPPLVVILQDFEASAGAALTDLISLLKRYSGLPIVLVFGVATTVTTLHSTLPHSATSKLTINTFGSPPASKLLDQVIEEVIISSDNPFQLSHRVFQFLVENFLFHDFAVEHFLQGYKFIVGEHFYRTPASFLCTDLKSAQAKLRTATEAELDAVRRLPSFRAMVETRPGDEGAKLLVDGAECRAEVARLLADYAANSRVFSALVRCLHLLVCQLPRKPLGKTLRDVHEHAMKGGLATSQQYKEAWQFLKLVSRFDLQEKCKQALAELSQVEDARLADLISSLEASLKKLEELVEEDTSCVSSPVPVVRSLSAAMTAQSRDATPASSLPTSALTTPAGSATNSPLANKNAGQKLDRFKLKEALLQSMKEKNKATPARPFDIIRTELLAAFNTAFTELLVPPSEMTLHEIFLFSAPGAVRRHLVGAPRAALHAALTDPWEYLDHPELKIQDAGEISASFPDICVGYKLHLECQKLINVYDWLVCWNTICTGDSEAAPDQVPRYYHHLKDHTKMYNHLQVQQARFSRVVQELQHLGFIKTSTRKTDHVARLTFGGS